MKHIDIEIRQRISSYGRSGWGGSWFAFSVNKRLAGYDNPERPGGDMDGDSPHPLDRDACLLAAIEKAQALGYDSFTITLHPHPDYAEGEGDEGDNDIDTLHAITNDLRVQMASLCDRIEGLDAVSRKVGKIGQYTMGLNDDINETQRQVNDLDAEVRRLASATLNMGTELNQRVDELLERVEALDGGE